MILSTRTIQSFLDDLAAKSPTPGGGAVASIVGALSAALAQMVLAYSRNKRSLVQHADLHDSALQRLDHARELLLQLAQADEDAYAQLNTILRLSEDDPERKRQLLPAAQQASQVPLAVMATCAELLRLFQELAPASNRFLLSDLAISAILAEATVRAAAWNVRANLPILAQHNADAPVREEMQRISAPLPELLADIELACA